MNGRVLKLIFLLAIKDDALLVNKIQDANPPEGAIKKLQQKLIFPILGISFYVHLRTPAPAESF